MIRRYELYNVISKLIIPLISLDRERAFNILLDRNKIKPEVVVHQLEKNQEYLYLVSPTKITYRYTPNIYLIISQYLDSMQKVNSNNIFQHKLVSLYAKYDRKKLLPFLRRSKEYVIQEALAICKREGFYPEVVYLLGCMGGVEAAEALNIIIHRVLSIKSL